MDNTEPLCDRHAWKETYYGYECKWCGAFVPFGCEPWAPEDNDEECSLDCEDES